jgi:hypothetical protein
MSLDGLKSLDQFVELGSEARAMLGFNDFDGRPPCVSTESVDVGSHELWPTVDVRLETP